MVDEPTIGEAMRRLDSVSKQMETLGRQMAEDRRDFASTYVRFDLYDSRHRGLDRRVTLMETENENREKADDDRRKQITIIVIGVALTAVASLLVSMVTLLAGGALGR